MKLFLSYSRQDLTIVQEAFFVLRDAGFDLWFDQEDIPPASRWKIEIKRGLDTCEAVILFASRYSLTSPYVKDEWVYALETLKKPVFVWWIDDYPLDPLLKDVPVFDLRADPLDSAQWLAGADAINHQKSFAAPVETRSRPAYVDIYLSRLRLVETVMTALIVIGFLFFFVAPTMPIILTLLVGFDVLRRRKFRHQIENRLTPINTYMPYSGALVVVWIGLFFILLSFAYDATYLCFIGGAIIVLPLLGLSLLAKPWAMRFWMGYEPFPYRNLAIKTLINQEDLPSFLRVNNSSLLEGVYSSKLYGWLPMFQPPKEPKGWAESKNSFAQVAEIITENDDPRVMIVYHPVDQYMADFLSANIETTRPIVLSSIMDSALMGDGYPGLLVLILSQYSRPFVDDLLADPQLLIKSSLWTILLEQRLSLPADLGSLQYFDASSWKFNATKTKFTALMAATAEDFTGNIDPRADPNKGTSAGYLLLWGFALLWAGIGIFMASLTHPMAIPYLVVCILIYLLVAMRKRPLALAGWALAGNLMLAVLFLSTTIDTLFSNTECLTILVVTAIQLASVLWGAPFLRRFARLSHYAGVGSPYNPVTAIIWAPKIPLNLLETLLLMIIFVVTLYGVVGAS